MKTNHLLLVLFLSVTLMGCPSKTITAQVKNSYPTNLSLEFFVENQWTRRRESQKISAVSFIRVSPDGGERIIVWSIGSNASNEVELTELTYGNLPAGFIVLENAKKINHGEKIVILYWSDRNNSTIVGSVETIIK